SGGTRRSEEDEKKEEELWRGKSEENQPEENGISSRHFSTAIIPPLTNKPRKVCDHVAGRGESGVAGRS
ncbi:MAG TPA: hypothetical protein VEH04_10610, partial [Verrucomicrobiae bacterium]|nr:hypothetical protein [Verrucomicrobiae bacterium]